MKRIFPLKAIALALFVAVFLGSCYLPVRYDAEITLHRTGHYDFKFAGYLVKVELFKDLSEGKISPAEEQKQIGIIRRDMGREKAIKDFKE